MLHTARTNLLRVGALSDVSSCEINLGLVLIELQEYESAVQYFQQAATRAQAQGQDTKYALCLVNRGWARTKQGLYTEALQAYGASREVYDKADLVRQRALYCDLNEGLVYRYLGQYGPSRKRLQRARLMFRHDGLVAALAECEVYLAQVFIETNRLRSAQGSLERARGLFRQTTQKGWQAICERELAALAVQCHDFSAAQKYLRTARRTFLNLGQSLEWMQCGLVAATSALAQKKFKRAAQLYQQACRAFRNLPELAWRAEYGSVPVNGEGISSCL